MHMPISYILTGASDRIRGPKSSDNGIVRIDPWNTRTAHHVQNEYHSRNRPYFPFGIIVVWIIVDSWDVLDGVAWQVSVAVGNAGPHARKAASVSVATNDQDGVAQAIERYVLAPRNVPVM